MAWIELHQELPRHPKTFILMGAIGVTQAAAVGHVVMSIVWCLEYATNGNIPNAYLIAAAMGAGWVGDPADFARGMVAARWWDEIEGGWHFHDWEQYAGRLIDKRATDAKRKSEERAKDALTKTAARPSGVRWTSDGQRSESKVPTYQPTVNLPNLPTMGDRANERDDVPPPVTPRTPLSGTALHAAHIGSPGSGNDNWQFTPEDVLKLIQAGEYFGIGGRELPHKILMSLGKRPDTAAFDRWYAMDAATIAAWCLEATNKTQAAKGRRVPPDPGLVNYAAVIIGERLECGSNLLEVQAVAAPVALGPLRPGNPRDAGRPMSTQQRNMAVLRSVYEKEMAKTPKEAT